jgi:hypothetical protein
MDFKKIYPLFCVAAIVLFIICSFKIKITQTVSNLSANSAETKIFLIELVNINPLAYEQGR